MLEHNKIQFSAAQGDVYKRQLQWLVMAGAWVTIIAGTKLWITLVLIGVFLLKTVIELALMAYYRGKM